MADLREVAVATAVAILFAVFFILLIDLVYDEPQYSDYCKDDFGPRAKPITAEVPKCDYVSSEEEQQCYQDGGVARTKLNESGCPVFDRCDFCNKDFDAARNAHDRIVFIILGLIGVVAIFGGTLWKIEFLASGIMFGGIILMFYATVRYFGEASKLLQIIIIFVELLIVLWIGYKKLYKPQVKKKRKK